MKLHDYLTRIRNAIKANHDHVIIPGSKQLKIITEVLYQSGYILNYTINHEDKKYSINIRLLYTKAHQPLLIDLKILTKNDQLWDSYIFNINGTYELIEHSQLSIYNRSVKGAIGLRLNEYISQNGNLDNK